MKQLLIVFPTNIEDGQRMAEKKVSKVPIIYTVAGYEAIAMRAKQQFNEYSNRLDCASWYSSDLQNIDSREIVIIDCLKNEFAKL